MGLLSKLSGSQAEPADDVQQARTRARQRLIGAVLLLGVGLIGFPLLFETQPRPIAVDIPIQIPRKEGQLPLALPAPKPAAASTAAPDGKLITETPADAGREVPLPAAPAVVPPKVAAAPADPTAAPPAASKAAAAEAARAKALLEGASAKAAPTPAAPAVVDDASAAVEARFVVQVGAYAEASAARVARARVEKLGLKAYTQVVTTKAGKRIRVRVGPFASRDDAAKAADKIKSAGLPTALLSL